MPRHRHCRKHKRRRVHARGKCKSCYVAWWKKTHRSPEVEAGKRRDRMLKAQYDLTQAEFHKLFNEQGGVCRICGAAPKPKRHLHVDHDHDTGLVRGLLCVNCNLGLGNLKDSVKVLRAAIRYLKENGK